MENNCWRSKTSCWLWGLGMVAGAGFTARMLLRKHARKTSPLIRSGETLTALVTGASSGIGAEYARALAALGYDVILVARREERLQALAQALTVTYGVHTAVLVTDLATEAGIANVEQVIAQTPNLVLLVNNAGFGIPGEFAEKCVSGQLDMIQVHVMATVRLTRAALPGMLAQHRGAIVNVSSIAAFYPLAGGVTYSATKSYLNSFTEALHQELVGTGVRVQALCPGFTRTDFVKASGHDLSGLPDITWLSTEDVVKRSLRDVASARVISVPGLVYTMLATLSRFLPRPLLYGLGRKIADLRRRGYHLFR